MKQISAASGATFGSVYHFFPDGKEQLAAEAIRLSGRSYRQLVAAVFDGAPSTIEGIRRCFVEAARVLEATDYEDACPIAIIALEVASTNDALRAVTAEVFEDWIEAATRRFRLDGLSRREARDLGIAVIGALEGAFLLSRALRSTEPMRAAMRSCLDTAQAALARASSRRRRRRSRP